MTRMAVAAWVLAVAAPALAGQEEFRWTGTLARGATLEVKGVNGRIEASPAATDRAEVTAVKRGRRSDPAGVRIDVIEHAGGVTLCAVYPDAGRTGARNGCAPGRADHLGSRDNDVRVDFAVKLPQGVRFAGRTVNGGITATGLGAGAEAETVNGSIEIVSSQAARASTVNGDVTARLGAARWNGTLELATVNGSVEAVLPADLSAEVKASTVNGSIATDFPLTVRGRLSSKSIQGTLGDGGRRLELATVNGSIALRSASKRRSSR